MLTTSCSSEDEVPLYRVRPDFEPHVQKFIEEAALRGMEIDFSDTGLSIQFREARDTASSGVCFIGQHRIEIERGDWNQLSMNNKEGLIFHELGHCELGRPHINALLPNGEWKSRMRGAPFTPGEPSPVINYSGRRRDYYVDELFDPSTPEPDWVSISQDYNFVSDDQRDVLYSHEPDTIEFKRSFSLPSGTDWEIELEMSDRETEEFVALIWGEDNNERSFRIGYNRERDFLIVSGEDIWGTIYQIENLDLIQSLEWNKLTVRHIDEVYYIFFNDQFIYWFDSNSQPIGTVQSLKRGDVTHFRNIRVSELVM